MEPNVPFYGCRYSTELFDILKELRCKKILSLNFENDYQGFVDVSCLLNDGRVFSYYYSYGSCSGCDTWEAAELTDVQIVETMLKEATFFDSLSLYNEWLRMKNESKKSL
jgi:hypothetical protein